MIWERNGERFEDCVVFHKVKEEWGGLSNMSNEFPLRVEGIDVPSSEALYQALRFPHQPDWQREILEASNAFVAKLMARKEGRSNNHSRADWHQIRVEAMKWCLRVKLAQNFQDFFLRLLRWTAPRQIVERSSKDRFWGAVKDKKDKDEVLRGENVLGRLLVELRDEAIALVAEGKQSQLLRVEPPAIADFRLLGREVGVVEGQA
jgi:ribA/ribD-fused uncharacterized protein